MLTANNNSPYEHQISEGFSDVGANAREYGAWTTSAADFLLPPECGDIYQIGEGGAGHILCVTGYSSGTVSSVDGGQVDNTWIQERSRTWTISGGHAIIGNRPVTGIQRIRTLRSLSENGRK
jgi:hypothetical protein